VTIPDYCLACDRQLAPGHARTHADHGASAARNVPWLLPVLLGAAWWLAFAGVVLAVAAVIA
jgi:hypothetical protein